MPECITITLPSELKMALDDATRQDGTTPNDFINQAIKEQLFLRKFRLLRDRLVLKAQTQGVESDQDIFDRVS